MHRRDFLRLSATAASAILLTRPRMSGEETPPVVVPPPANGALFQLPELPWTKDALQPYISAETIDFHYGKHHRAYADYLNKNLTGKPDAGKSIEEIITSSDGPLFNNAAQFWNHSFYWKSLSPKGGGDPKDALAEAIIKDFGSVDKFKKAFAKAALSQFGSGWAWLVFDQGKLAITTTSNADLPLKHNQAALLTVDVWEHAYYIDYRNARAKYVDSVLEHLLNWDFAAANYAKAIKA